MSEGQTVTARKGGFVVPVTSAPKVSGGCCGEPSTSLIQISSDAAPTAVSGCCGETVSSDAGSTGCCGEPAEKQGCCG